MVWSDQSSFPFYVIDNNGNIVLTIDNTGMHLTGTAGNIDIITSDVTGQPTINFYNPDRSHYAFINFPFVGGTYTLGLNSGDRISTLDNVTQVRDRLWFSSNSITLGTMKTSDQAIIGGQVLLWDKGALMKHSDVNKVDFAEVLAAENQVYITARNSTGTISSSQIQVSDGIISIQSSDGITQLNGPGLFFGKDTIQFKTTLNEANAVQYNQATKFLDVLGQPWTNIPLAGDWVASAAPLQVPQYKLMPDGTVMLRGAMQSPTVATGVAFNLPVGFRPPATLNFAVSTSQTTGVGVPRLQIASSGACDFSGNVAATSIRVDGIRFAIV